MIVTNLKSPELELYASLNKYFPAVLNEARKVLFNPPEAGNYAIDGDNCYYGIQRIDAKSPFDALFETHNEYIDIHMVISGEEIIRFENKSKLSFVKQHSEDCDMFAMNKDYDSVRLTPGDLVIVYPNEAHAPCIRAEGTDGKICKMIVKIKNS
ncbi:MAG: YhcH/YjgK/YiaL family protein [Clostridia bacterium]|nr:YhcH/YjgK/YiaL family protein [Clostridia bacterium]